MRDKLLNILKCINCGKSEFNLTIEKQDNHEIIEGKVTCNICETAFIIERGILQFNIHDKKVLREISQWETFADSEGWVKLDELYLESLPSAGSNILIKQDTIQWIYHEYNFFKMLKSLDIKNKLILDMGAGRGWSSKWMTLLGGVVVAFDAMSHPAIGLGASAVFFRNHNIFFERVTGDFNNLPFNDGNFDLVFTTGSLHHSVNISKTIYEISRVLKSKGIFAVVNEPVAGIRTRVEQCMMNGFQKGINEHVYRMTKIFRLLKANNLIFQNHNESIHVYDPHSPYYQGIFSSCINRTKWGRMIYLFLMGGVLNGIWKKCDI